MPNFKYMLERIASMDYSRMFRTIDEMHDRTGISKFRLFADVVYCGLRYGAGYNDYKLCEFYDLNRKQRETYVTRGINNKIVRMLNDKQYVDIFANKLLFNEKFEKYLNRKWINLHKASFEDFEEFASDLDIIITKPEDGTCGHGVEKLYKKDFENVRVLYDHIIASGNMLAEECITQHPDVARLYPLSINTYRIVTVYVDGEAHVVYAYIRIGNHGNYVDNFNSGGMSCPVDVNTGIITHPGYDKEQMEYEVHPMTNVRLVGYQLPYWKEACDMCIEAAYVVPEVGYIAWDVAISDKGPVFVEGNDFPGHDILQMPPHVPDKIGMLPEFRKYIKNL